MKNLPTLCTFAVQQAIRAFLIVHTQLAIFAFDKRELACPNAQIIF
jgi:hypothetical protein